MALTQKIWWGCRKVVFFAMLLSTAWAQEVSQPQEAQKPPEAPKPPEEVFRLPEVLVTAPARLPEVPLPPSSIPASVQVIPGEEIRKAKALNLQDVLQKLPGVFINDEQGNAFQPDLSFRGFTGTSVTGIPQGISVFLDGVRINEPAVEEINFDLIPLDDIERIEIIRGPSAIFGRNTLAGAVNIITRRGGVERELVPELSGGLFGRQKYRLHLSGSFGPPQQAGPGPVERGSFDYYVSATHFREEGWRAESGTRIAQAFGKLGYREGGTDFTFSYQYANNKIKQAGSLPLSLLNANRRENFTGGDFFEPLLNLGTFNARQELGKGFTLAFNAFGRKLSAEQFNVSLIGENTRTMNDTLSAGGTLQLSHQAQILGRENLLILGAEYLNHQVDVEVFEEQNERTLRECIEEALAGGEDPAEECPLKALASALKDTQQGFALYAQDTFDLAKDLILSGDSLILTGAVRWDWLRHDIVDRSPFDPENPDRPSATGVSTFSRVNPRVGFNYNLSKDYGFYFAFSQGFRAPAFLELSCASPAAICPGLQAGVAPDPPLKPVRANNYEVGFRMRPFSWVEGDVNLFRTDVKDDIFSVSPTGTIGVFFQNIAKTRRQGIEVSLRGTYRGLLDGYLNYAFTDATFREDVELTTPRNTGNPPGCGIGGPGCIQRVRKGNDLPLVPPHRVNAGLDYHVTKGLTLSLGLTYVGEQRFRGDEENVERKLRDYVLLNGGITLRQGPFTAFAVVNNLLNQEYSTFGSFAPNARLEEAPIEPFLTPAPPIHALFGVSYRF